MKKIYFLLSVFCLMLATSCSNDDDDTTQSSTDPNILQIAEEDILHTVVNLKWNTVSTTENNTDVIYDIFLEGNKIKENNADTDYTLTRLKSNTTYSGEIIARNIAKTSKNKNAKLGELKKIPFEVTTRKYKNPNAAEPSEFLITVEDISTTAATIQWSTATITDNSQITYTIYIDGDEVGNTIAERVITLKELEKNTNYIGEIIAKSSNEKSQYASFSFKTPEVDEVIIDVNEVKITPAALSITIGNTEKLTATILPEDASNKNITWSSSNTDIATVDAEGNVTAIAEGTVAIKVTSDENDQISSTSTITVEASTVEVTEIKVTPETLSIVIGNITQLTATVLPENASNQNVNWSSSNMNIATVDANGTINAIAQGTVTITTTSVGNPEISDSTVVTVNNTIPATSIEIDQSDIFDLFEREVTYMSAKILPENATDKNIIWTSDDPSIAAVSNTGYITAMSPGTTTIKATASSDNQISDSRTVTVIANLTSFDPETGLYKAPPGSTIKINGFGELLNTDPIAQLSFEIAVHTLPNKMGTKLYEDFASAFVSDDPGTKFLNLIQSEFIMPQNGEVYFSATLLINNENDGYLDLQITNDLGFTEFYNMNWDQQIVQFF